MISLTDLLQNQMSKAKAIYTDCCKGVMVPPVIVDINGDFVGDIIVSLFNSTVAAFDGVTYEIIWKKEFPGSETYRYPSYMYELSVYTRDDCSAPQPSEGSMMTTFQTSLSHINSDRDSLFTTTRGLQFWMDGMEKNS